MKDLVKELLALQLAAQNALIEARKVGDVELAQAIRDIGWKTAECLAKVARQQAQIGAAS